MATTQANRLRAQKKETLRELLSNKGLVQKVLVIVDEIDQLAKSDLADVKPEDRASALSVAKDRANIMKIGIDTRLRLINKYLPDLKSTELTGDPDNPVKVSSSVSFVDAIDEDDEIKGSSVDG